MSKHWVDKLIEEGPLRYQGKIIDEMNADETLQAQHALDVEKWKLKLVAQVYRDECGMKQDHGYPHTPRGQELRAQKRALNALYGAVRRQRNITLAWERNVFHV